MYVQHVVAITPKVEHQSESQRSRITRVSGPVRPAWAIPEPRLRRHLVHHLPFHVSLRHRLRRRFRGAKNRRHRSRDNAATADACGSRQSRTARHFRDPAQRHGAPRLQAYPDEGCAARDRAQHLRALRQRGPHPAVRALAAAAAGRMADRQRQGCRARVFIVRIRLAYRALQHLPDQPLRTIRREAGSAQRGRPRHPRHRLQDARSLSRRPASDLSRLSDRILGCARHDVRATAARCRHYDLYLYRHCTGGTRPHRDVWRPVSPLSRPRGNASAGPVLNRNYQRVRSKNRPVIRGGRPVADLPQETRTGQRDDRRTRARSSRRFPEQTDPRKFESLVAWSLSWRSSVGNLTTSASRRRCPASSSRPWRPRSRGCRPGRAGSTKSSSTATGSRSTSPTRRCRYSPGAVTTGRIVSRRSPTTPGTSRQAPPSSTARSWCRPPTARPTFPVLQNELKGKSTSIGLVAFDLLYLNGGD